MEWEMVMQVIAPIHPTLAGLFAHFAYRFLHCGISLTKGVTLTWRYGTVGN